MALQTHYEVAAVGAVGEYIFFSLGNSLRMASVGKMWMCRNYFAPFTFFVQRNAHAAGIGV